MYKQYAKRIKRQMHCKKLKFKIKIKIDATNVRVKT